MSTRDDLHALVDRLPDHGGLGFDILPEEEMPAAEAQADDGHGRHERLQAELEPSAADHPAILSGVRPVGEFILRFGLPPHQALHDPNCETTSRVDRAGQAEHNPADLGLVEDY